MSEDRHGKTPMNLELSLKYSKEELIAALALVALDVAFCNYDHWEGGDGHIQLLLLCNDTFGYACSDCEEVPISEAPMLLKLERAEGWPAIVRYISEKRGGEKPIGPIQKMMDEYKPKAKPT